MRPHSLFLESLQVRYIHIQPYELDYRWKLSGHRLKHTVLWHVQEGQFVMQVDGTGYTCHAGQLALIPAGSILTTQASTDRVRLTSLNLEATITFLETRSWAQVLGLPVLFQDPSARMQTVVQEMLALSNGEAGLDVLLPMRMQAELLRLIVLLLEESNIAEIGSSSAAASYNEGAAAAPGVKDNAALDPRVLTVIDYLLCHSDWMPKVSELAELAELSESQLRKLFIRHTGQSPLQFVHRLKMELAKKLLIRTSKPVAQIACELGLADANYFTRLFRMQTNLAPLHYRRQFQLWGGE
ncbi:helix-turn-helix domain-containing protein [Paenibacillus sp. GCM10023252]|uniref:helix-turn-helix domain-containing protein n=1 Tax=Paenibacillus sp. GCM10023252 TaxID=3252649 RepID=UPI00362441F0